MRPALSAICLLATITTTAAAQFPQPTGFAVEDPILRRIWAIESDSSELPRLAQVLFDSLGPRLTASPGMTAAQNWAVATYTAWGIAARRSSTARGAAGGAARATSISSRRGSGRSKARCSRGARAHRAAGRCARLS